MREIALHVLDILENSIKAFSTLITVRISVDSLKKTLVLEITDNGIGMDDFTLNNIDDPYFTTEKTKTLGMGIPFLKLSTDITGGSLKIESKTNKGTKVKALFCLDSINCLPLGNLGESISVLISNLNNCRIKLFFEMDSKKFRFDTKILQKMFENSSNVNVVIFVKNLINENIIGIGGANL